VNTSGDGTTISHDQVERRRRAHRVSRSTLCQARAVERFSVGGLCLTEEVWREGDVGVKNLDSDEAVVLPVKRDKRLDAGRCLGLDGGSAGCELFVGELEVRAPMTKGEVEAAKKIPVTKKN